MQVVELLTRVHRPGLGDPASQLAVSRRQHLGRRGDEAVSQDGRCGRLPPAPPEGRRAGGDGRGGRHAAVFLRHDRHRARHDGRQHALGADHRLHGRLAIDLSRGTDLQRGAVRLAFCHRVLRRFDRARPGGRRRGRSCSTRAVGCATSAASPVASVTAPVRRLRAPVMPCRPVAADPPRSRIADAFPETWTYAASLEGSLALAGNGGDAGTSLCCDTVLPLYCRCARRLARCGARGVGRDGRRSGRPCLQLRRRRRRGKRKPRVARGRGAIRVASPTWQRWPRPRAACCRCSWALPRSAT